MDRSPSRRCAWFMVMLVLLAPAAGGGCNVLAAAGYVFHQDNLPPEFADLKGKRVAVVCRPVLQLEYADTGAAPDLAAVVGALLAQNVKKIHVVSPSEVAQWADEHTWENYTEIGKAVKADYVIGIDLEQFSLYQGPTLYQGRSEVHVWVYDMKDGGKRVWEKKLPPMVFPPNSAVAASERPESDFRRQYIGELAQHIGRIFYEYDPSDEICSDARALNSPSGQ